MRAVLTRYRELRHSRRWVRWAEDALLVLAVLGGVMAWQTRNLVSSGEVAPPFVLQDLQGRTWTLDALRGKTVLLHFWAPWCGVCKTESPTISSVHRGADEEVVVLSVATAYEEPEQVRAFVGEHSVDYPVLLDRGAVTHAYRVNAFPTTYVIGPEGTIRHAAVGFTTRLGLWARLWW